MDNSRLGKLPAELRNQIWELALHQDTPIELEQTTNQSTTGKLLAAADNQNCISAYLASIFEASQIHGSTSAGNYLLIGLLKTCRAIYAESCSMFYIFNTFAVAVRSEHEATRILRLFDHQFTEGALVRTKLIILCRFSRSIECFQINIIECGGSSAGVEIGLVYSWLVSTKIEKSRWRLAFQFKDTKVRTIDHRELDTEDKMIRRDNIYQMICDEPTIH